LRKEAEFVILDKLHNFPGTFLCILPSCIFPKIWYNNNRQGERLPKKENRLRDTTGDSIKKNLKQEKTP